MSKITDLKAWKKKRDKKGPTYTTYLDKDENLCPTSEVDFATRIGRIRDSINRINKLMGETRSGATKK